MIDVIAKLKDRAAVRSLLALACTIIGGGSIHVAPAAETKTLQRHAFISGFERFARHDGLSDSLAGSLLISELSCGGCHPTSDLQLAAKGGPNLSATGVRLQSDWLHRYLLDPAAVKPGTTMPHLLAGRAGADQEDAAAALSAFLSTQRKPFATIKATGAMPVVHEFWKRGDSQRGRELYHTVGCVACHEPDQDYQTSDAKPSAIDQLISQLDPTEIAELGLADAARRVESVPHGDLAEKYTKRSLTMFLFDPAETRPSARMPSLRLSPSEAADIAAYLLRQQSSDVVAGDPSTDQHLIDRGRSLFVELRCANCHQVSSSVAPIHAKPMDQLDTGARSSCVKNPRAGMPRYEIDAEQIAAINRRLMRATPSNPNSGGQATHASDVQFRMTQLNCYACHQRDAVEPERGAAGGIGRFRKPYFETLGQVDLGDEGRLPPTLTGVGRKLLPKSIADVFSASKPPRRAYMTIRMPAYQHDAVETLIEQLPIADRVDASTATQVFGANKDLADQGRQIVGTGCVECHPFRGESLTGVVGIDLADITRTVHPRWFYEFVLNPGAVKERTRMPTFFPDGRSNQPDLLDGDPQRQIAAIWAYLNDLNQQPLPEKIAAARSANYELAPKDRPIVLRTFMDGAGTHAIAVGFPAGVHYAFDAERVRLALGWKQRFLDARGTWFERFAPPAEPLGESLQSFPPGPAFAIFAAGSEPQLPLRDQDAYRFGGYKLDANGVPTLLYRLQRWQIEDRLQPLDNKGLRRTFTIRENVLHTGPHDQQLELWFMAHADRKLASDGPTAMVGGDGLKVSLPADVANTGQLRQAGGVTQWWFRLTQSGERTWVVEYHW